MLCIYAIVRASAASALDGVTGVHRADVVSVIEGDVRAIVSEIDGDLLARRRDVEAHLDVVERVFSQDTVLPFRFGMVVEDDTALRRFLRDQQDRYLQLLASLHGLAQMTLKAVRDEDETIRTVVNADPRLQKVVRKLQGSPVVSDQIELGESVAGAVELLSARDAHDIVKRLDMHARQTVVDVVAAPTVVSLSLLQRPDETTALDEEVARLFDDYGKRMTFSYAGPMPPYAFMS